MRLRDELRDPWGILIGGIAGGLGWAIGIPAAAAAGIGAAVWAVKSVAGAVSGRGDSGEGAASFDPAEVHDALRRLRSRVKGRLPKEILQKVDAIIDTIDGILPRARSLGPGSQDLYVLTRTAMDYLPTAIDSFIDLSPDYAAEHPISEGRTAAQILGGQLDLLQSQLDGIAIAVNKNDSDKLLAHGRFLEDRFGRHDLSIDNPKDDKRKR